MALSVHPPEPVEAPLEEALGLGALVLLEEHDREEVGGLEGVHVVLTEDLASGGGGEITTRRGEVRVATAR